MKVQYSARYLVDANNNNIHTGWKINFIIKKINEK
jgi:hypothetical protein